MGPSYLGPIWVPFIWGPFWAHWGPFMFIGGPFGALWRLVYLFGALGSFWGARWLIWAYFASCTVYPALAWTENC